MRSADEEIEDLVGPVYTDQIVVTASRTEQSILEAPVSITVIGEDQIAASAADNIGDLLRGVPGLNVVQTSARDINLSSRSPGTTLSAGQLALQWRQEGRSPWWTGRWTSTHRMVLAPAMKTER